MPNDWSFKSEHADLTVAIENTFGTYVEPSKPFGLISDDVELPDPEHNAELESYIGGGRKPDGKMQGQTEYPETTISMKPVDPRPFLFLLGDELDFDGVDTHLLGVKETDPPLSQTIQAVYDNPAGETFVRSYIASVCSGGEISVGNDNDLTVDLDYTCIDVDTTQTAGTPDNTVLDRDPWSFRDTQSNLTMFGIEFARLQDFTVSVTQNVEDGRYINTKSPNPYDLTYGNAEFDTSLTLAITNSDVYIDLLENEQEFETSITFEKGSTGETLRITLQRCQVTSAPHGIPEDGEVEVDVEIIFEDIEVEVQDIQGGSSLL